MKKLLLALLTVSLLSSIPLLADAWDPPSSYYNLATGTGSTLKTQLTTCMSASHYQSTYGEFRYSAAIHDQDPYNSSHILLCYNRASVSGAWDGGSTWNREHVWPQSLQPGSASNSTTGCLGDAHALLPCNPSINSSRSNKPYGGAALVGTYRHNGSYYFPGDDDKGDIARILFYCATRWSSKGLTLVNGIPGSNQMGDLASLLRWHYMDTPDEFERRRNHTIYSRAYNPSYYTNNRNAYIDHPEFVWSVFGGDDNDTMLYVGPSHNSDGSSEVIYDLGGIWANSSSTIDPVSVTLSKTGNDGTYYEITDSSNVTSSGAPSGYFKAFDYGTKSLKLTISIDNIPTTPGRYTETVTVDNLDVCGNSPTGCGSNDKDDVITITYTVLAADINDDGVVDSDDILTLAANWLTVVPALNIVDGPSDTTGMLNLYDLAVLATEFVND